MKDKSAEDIINFMYEDINNIKFKLGTARARDSKLILQIHPEILDIFKASDNCYYNCRHNTVIGYSAIVDPCVEDFRFLVDVLYV